MEEFRFGLNLKQLTEENGKIINEELKSQGLTLSQVHLLKYIFLNYENQDIIQRDIEKHLDISNPTVCGLLTRLEQKELIERVGCPSDARSRCIRPTQKSLGLESIINESFIKSNQRLVLGFSDEEKKELEQYIIRMQNNVKESGKKL